MTEPPASRPEPVFVPPDTDAPLDTAERLAAVPRDSTMKGWLFQSVVNRARDSGAMLSRAKRYLPFKDYPVHDYIQLLDEAACVIRPDEPPRQTLRGLGASVYPAFAQSLFGRVIVSTLSGQDDPARSGLHMVSRVYQMTRKGSAHAELMNEGDGHAVIALRRVWSFPECYHVGILEGAARGFDREVTVTIAQHSLCDVDVRLEWDPDIAARG